LVKGRFHLRQVLLYFDYLPYWKIQLSAAVTLSQTWIHPSRDAIKITLSICAHVTAGAQLMLIHSDAGEF
jgi:hypothetical protein